MPRGEKETQMGPETTITNGSTHSGPNKWAMAMDQIDDHRLADTAVTELRFCEHSGEYASTDAPRPEPEVIWAD